MKKYIISEDEKSRILNMHKDAIKKQYLSEQQSPTIQPQGTTEVGKKEYYKLRENEIGFGTSGDFSVNQTIYVRIPQNNKLKLTGGDHNFSCKTYGYLQKNLTPGDIKQITVDSKLQTELVDAVKFFCQKQK
jgi:hypothetical protein